MTKVKTASINNIHKQLARLSLQELETSDDSHYKKYSYLFGLNHLRIIGNIEEYKHRLLNISFIGCCLNSGKTNQDLFSYWHSTGDIELDSVLLDKAHENAIKSFCKNAQNLSDLNILHAVTDYLTHSALYYSSKVGHKKEIQLSQKFYGEKDEKTLSAQYGLILVKAELGKVSEIINDLDELIKKQRELFGEFHKTTLKSMMLQADFLNMNGKNEESEFQIKYVNKLLTKHHGKFHSLTLESLNVYGVRLLENGKIEEALHNFNTCLNRRIKIDGERSVGVQICKINIASCFLRLGEITKAITVSKDSSDLLEDILGETHSNTILTRLVLAKSYTYGENYQEAKAIFCKNSALFAKIHGNDHPRTWIEFLNFADVLYILEEYDFSIKIIEKQIKNALQTQTYAHPTVQRGLFMAARTYHALENLGRSKYYYQLILEKMNDNNQNIGEDYCVMLIEFADVLIEEKQFEEADKFKQEAYQIRIKIHGEDHPDTTYTLYELGLLHQQAGNASKAIDFFSKELAHCQNFYGPNHDETVNSRSNLVELMVETKNFSLAAIELRHLSEYYQNLFTNAPEEATCISISSLGKKFYECGLIKDAIEHLEISISLLEKMLNDTRDINLRQYINVLEYLAFLFNKDGQRQKEIDLKSLIQSKKKSTS